MNYALLNQLRAWRDEQARIEGTENYRVLPNSALEELARVLPEDRDALCTVKGIKEAKYRKYGKALLAMIGEYTGGENTESDFGTKEDKLIVPSAPAVPIEPLSVSQFLDSLNLELSGLAARVRGEISSLDVRERVVYFSLKDSTDESMVNCLIFRSQYAVSGVSLAIGDEVIVEGVPDIYKPSGRLSLRVGVIEYAGEGALKKAYDALYAKLESAGVFSVEEKRPVPDFVDRVALITSEQGAAIGDFTTNLVRAGIQIDFYPTLVEGKRAVFEIIEAIRFFNTVPERYAALVIIRGGGSLESLAAFNTEALVKEVRSSRIPVLAGIGHERDVSLVALAADAMVSTPTAAARFLSAPWDEARVRLNQYASVCISTLQACQMLARDRVQSGQETLQRALQNILEQVSTVELRFRDVLTRFPEYSRRTTSRLETNIMLWQALAGAAVTAARAQLRERTTRLRQYDPMRALQLGYSLVQKGGHIIRTTESLSVGDRIDIRLGQGSVESEITSVRNTL